MKIMLAFVSGCVLTSAMFGMWVNDLKGALRNAQALTEQQKAALKANDEGKLQEVQAALKESNQQRDTCQAKFARYTVLYVQPKNLFGNPIGAPHKSWAVPADIEPVYVGQAVGMFSHYDPKTQVETVKFQAKK